MLHLCIGSNVAYLAVNLLGILHSLIETSWKLNNVQFEMIYTMLMVDNIYTALWQTYSGQYRQNFVRIGWVM